MTDKRQLDIRKSIIVSIIVFIFCVFLAAILICWVKPIDETIQNDNSRAALSILSAVLGILASGCIAGFFAFKYAEAAYKEKASIILITWLFILAIFILIGLSMYCLRRIGAFDIIDPWAAVFLFLGTFFLLDGIVLLERWDAATLPKQNIKLGD
jgi:small-conductance mechanosensitive channel